MENLSLFDFLVGHFISEEQDPVNIDSTYFDRMDEDKKLRQSIVENLKLILQTRRGSVLHLEDFGIPDVLQVYFNSGNSLDPVTKMIRETIIKYEPRISDAKVLKSDFDPNSMRISLKIIATIKQGSEKEILLTEFSTTGWTKVIFEKDLK